MPIIRNPDSFEDPYTRIPNYWVRDSRLSLAAIGLITQIMSHSVGWSISQESLGRANNVGRDSIRTILNELMEHGYLTRSDERERNSSGHLGGYTYWTSSPVSSDATTTAEPTLAEPTLAETAHKKNILKEEQVKEETLNASVDEEFLEQFKKFWELYPRKIDKGRAVKDFRSALKRASFEVILAGVAAYKDDPYRKPQFTKYPSSWLNADAWDNFITSSEAREATEKRRTKDLAYKDKYLEDQRSQEALSAPAPKCEHGNTVALCRRCLAR